MASTYTVNGIELIANGEQTNSWGTTTNENWELMEEMVAGGVSIALTGTTYTLTTTDGVSSDGRHAVIIFTGTPGGTCTVTISPNDVQKTYYIVNNSDETVTMSQGSGTTVDIDASTSKVIFCDGGGASAAVTDLSTTLAALGVTASAAELNIMDGVTASTAEINLLDGATNTILQVVEGVKASDTTTSSTSYIDISLNASITPSSASNKILIFAVVNGFSLRDGEDDAGFSIQLLRDATALTAKSATSNSNNVISEGIRADLSFMYLDSPATTSSTTYNVYGNLIYSGGSTTVTFYAGARIILMEVAA